MAEPFLKWAGGKRQLLPELEKRVPKFSGTYFEPFLGGGALFFHLEFHRAVLSDANAALVNAYATVRDFPNEVILELEKKENNEKFYYEERNRQPYSIIDGAARFIYLNRTCFNGLYRVNRKGKFNVPFGSYKNPDIAGEARVLSASEALRSATIVATDFEAAVTDASSKDFVYFDPPYAPVSTTSSFTSFTRDGFTAGDQERLRDACLKLKERGVPFLLSNSGSELIRSLYSGPRFRIEEVTARRAINSKGARRGGVTELLIT